MIKTYLCTLNWNTTDWLIRMVDSVEAQTLGPHEWIIVDNGSDPSEASTLRAFLTAFDGRHRAGFLPENLGCIHGYNHAFDVVDKVRRGAPCQIVMINTDVTVHEWGWLTKVTAWAQAHPEVGIIGLEHSRGATCASPIFLDRHGNWYVHERANMSTTPQEGETVGLGFALLRPPVVEAGLRFDSLYEMYYKQDDDFVFQMRRDLGLQAWVYPVDCIHHGRASIEANEYRVGEAENARQFDAMKQENQRRFAERWAWALRSRRGSMEEEARHLKAMEGLMAKESAGNCE